MLSESEQANQAILFDSLPLANDKSLGIITLNSESTLNALSLAMIEPMMSQLRAWEADPKIVAILLQSAGDKAFSAGGDIQSLYHWIQSYLQNNDKDSLKQAEGFFQREYELDFYLHNYPKPIITWGHGIIMGGGFGIYSGCRFRIVTESTRIAMPEVAIAFFPDVGASYYLNRIKNNAGRFLALTGSTLNAADGLAAGVADCFLLSNHKETLIQALQQQAWVDDNQENTQIIQQLLHRFGKQRTAELPTSNLSRYEEEINRLAAASSLLEFSESINAITDDQAWFTRARDNFRYSSPLALQWTDRHLALCQGLEYEQVLQKDLVLAVNIIRGSEFVEGIRARVIDKDQKPNWRYKDIEKVPPEEVNAMFVQPWTENPLRI